MAQYFAYRPLLDESRRLLGRDGLIIKTKSFLELISITPLAILRSLKVSNRSATDFVFEKMHFEKGRHVEILFEKGMKIDALFQNYFWTYKPAESSCTCLAACRLHFLVSLISDSLYFNLVTKHSLRQ